MNEMILEGAAAFFWIGASKRLFEVFAESRERKFVWAVCAAATVLMTLIHGGAGSSGRGTLCEIAALLAVSMCFQIKFWERLLLVTAVYMGSVTMEGIMIFIFTGHLYNSGAPSLRFISGIGILLVSFGLEKAVSRIQGSALPAYCRWMLGSVPAAALLGYSILVMNQSLRPELIPVIAGGLFLVQCAVFCLYRTLFRFYSESLENQIWEERRQAYTYQISVMRESQESINALRHDLKHHIIELRSLIEKKQNSEAVQYLEHMRSFMLNPTEYAATGNPELDGVINYLLRNARERLKRVVTDIRVPPELFQGDFTITLILGNLLENAVREAEYSAEKELELHVRSRKGILLIEVGNSCSKEGSGKERRSFGTENSGARYGIGLENVKRAVYENGGELDIVREEKRFLVKVLLYEKNGCPVRSNC